MAEPPKITISDETRKTLLKPLTLPALQAIEAGNCPEAVRALCSILAADLDGAAPEARAWLLAALTRIAAGEDPDSALGLKKSGKEQPFSTIGNVALRDIVLADEIHVLRAGHNLTRNESSDGPPSACDIMEEKYRDMLGLSASHFYTIYRKHYSD